jgi:biotin transport system substrate-specific component
VKEAFIMAISPGTTIIHYLVPARTSRTTALVQDGLLVVGFSILMALSARAQIILPFTPVPITLQTLVVILAGAVLGSKRGALAMLLYLLEGATGLPIFAKGGGLPYLIVAPTAGYLWSYPLAAFVVGLLCERGLDRSFLTSIVSMLPGSLLIYAIGVPWLALVLHISLSQALIFGMYPFLIGDAIKIVIAAALLPAGWLVARKIKPDVR